MSEAEIGKITGWLALLRGEARALREAGILSVSVGGCSATFAPLAVPLAAGEVERPDATVPTEGLDALNDPHSYPAGIVPGYDLEGARRERSRLPEGLDE